MSVKLIGGFIATAIITIVVGVGALTLTGNPSENASNPALGNMMELAAMV